MDQGPGSPAPTGSGLGRLSPSPKSCFPAPLKSYPIPAEASISLAWSWATEARVSKVPQPEEGPPRPGGLESDPTARFCTGSGLCSSPSDFLGGLGPEGLPQSVSGGVCGELPGRVGLGQGGGWDQQCLGSGKPQRKVVAADVFGLAPLGFVSPELGLAF